MPTKLITHFILGTILGVLSALAINPSLGEVYKNLLREKHDVSLFEEVLEIVDTRYYTEDVDFENMMNVGMTAGLQSLDKYSVYYPPEKMKKTVSIVKGKPGRIGIKFTPESLPLEISGADEDSPAAQMEFEPGDILLQIDDIDVSSIPTMEEAHQTARQALLGDIGSTVKLKIYSRTEQKVVELTTQRAQIISKASRVRMEGDVMVIRISTFNQNTYPQMKEGVEDMLNKRGDTIIGAVIDLRGNPGGLLEQAAASSDAFLEGGVITTIKWPNGREEEHSAKAGDMLDGLPITVLINEKSASGAEIMAGALQENKRALVMGIRSLGKGSVQTISYLPNNGGMKMTTALYYTPSGRSINHLGISPDIWVEDAPAKSLPNNESVFYDHLISRATTDEARQTLEKEKRAFLQKQRLRAQDSQMAAALDSIVSQQND